jgi:hypothetical protein
VEGLPPSPAQHRNHQRDLLHRNLQPRSWRTIIGEPNQHPMPANVPCPIDPVQVNVSHQRRNDSPNTMGNFCFDVTLGYRLSEGSRHWRQRATDNM